MTSRVWLHPPVPYPAGVQKSIWPFKMDPDYQRLTSLRRATDDAVISIEDSFGHVFRQSYQFTVVTEHCRTTETVMWYLQDRC